MFIVRALRRMGRDSRPFDRNALSLEPRIPDTSALRVVWNRASHHQGIDESITWNERAPPRAALLVPNVAT